MSKNWTDKDDEMKSSSDLYYEYAEKEYGKIDKNNPLYIVSCFKPGGLAWQSIRPEYIQAHKYLFDKYLKTPHKYVCITNEDIPEVDCIPLELDYNDAPYWYT